MIFIYPKNNPGHPSNNLINDSKRNILHETKTPSIVLRVYNENNSIEISVYNILSVEEKRITILKNPSVNIPKIGNKISSQFVSIFTDYFSSTKTEHIYACKDSLYYINTIGGIAKNINKLKNIFEYNYSTIPIINEFQLYNKSIDGKETKFWDDNDNDFLHQLKNTLGYPHETTGDNEGNEFLFYFGHHQCKQGIQIGFVMFKIDVNQRLRSIYKYMQICPSCSGMNTQLIEHNENVDYC